MKLIPLTKGYSAMVDDEDFEKVSKFKWCARPLRNGFVYAFRGLREPKIALRQYGKVKAILLHRFILDAPAETQIRHLDRNGLNCQRSNLVEPSYVYYVPTKEILSQEIKIEENVPFPARKYSGIYPFEKMKIGDSFFVDSKAGQSPHNLRCTVYQSCDWYIKKYNTAQKFSVKSFENGIRIWRVK